ncbi:MAG: fluoride efflux transporter CrcB [Alphaproteobacteria bacterium]|jgi:CrcB protein|nr:fluoride efflux transporter CrcB [Alphaproteobacteria bacterium]
MNMILAIALGGAAGAVGRHFVNVGMVSLVGHGFPWGTLVVNVVGSLIMGVLIHAMATSWTVSPELRALMTVGALGAFTTFSTFSLDVVLLYERGQVGLAAIYVIVSVTLSVGALFVGLKLARTVFA